MLEEKDREVLNRSQSPADEEEDDDAMDEIVGLLDEKDIQPFSMFPAKDHAIIGGTKHSLSPSPFKNKNNGLQEVAAMGNPKRYSMPAE